MTNFIGQTRVWGFEPDLASTEVEAWVESPTSVLVTRGGGASGFTANLTPGATDLWGYTAGGERVVYVSSPTIPSLRRGTILGGNLAVSGKALSQSPMAAGVSAVGGVAHPDGSVELWAATIPTSVDGARVGPSPMLTVGPTTSLTAGLPNPTTISSLFASEGYLWVGVSEGLFVIPRPSL